MRVNGSSYTAGRIRRKNLNARAERRERREGANEGYCRMISSTMIPTVSIFVRTLPFAAALLIMFGGSATAQVPRPYPDQQKAEEAKKLVHDFFEFGFDPGGIRRVDIPRYAVDDLADYLNKNAGSPFWPIPQKYQVDDVMKVYDTDSAAIVTSRTFPDSLPYLGRLAIDWVWFLRQVDGGAWRISAVRRTTGMNKAIDMLRYIDTTSVFPEKVKPQIAREESTILLSNNDIRTMFPRVKAPLGRLADILAREDSIRYIERTGDRISLFNTTMLDWGGASHDVPPEALEEYMAKADAQERKQMEARIRAAEKQKKEGYLALGNLARKALMKPQTLDTITQLMKEANVTFLNAELPWKNTLMFTLAGKVNDVVGFLYAPDGELPLLSPMEYFYLEDLGDGWWIFRAT